MIYCFGNSHVHVFTDSKPNIIDTFITKYPFISYSLGPVIAYNFAINHLPKIENLLIQIDIQKNDYIGLIVSEVDCRWHLPYQANKQNRTPEDVVEECLDRFFPCIKKLSIQYNVFGFSGHPTTIGPHNDDSSNPVFGSCDLRNNFCKLWRDGLKQRCDNIKIPFIDILDFLIDKNGLTKMEYYDDYCHMSYKKTIDIILNEFRIKEVL